MNVGCPKNMVYGPCGGVRANGGCEVTGLPCPFVREPRLEWAPPGATGSGLAETDLTGTDLTGTDLARTGPLRGVDVERWPLSAPGGRPLVVTDLTVAPYDRRSVETVVALLSDSADALLVGEHQNRPDYPPTLMATLVASAGARPWVTLTCRDRNRVVLESELAGLAALGVDGVHCVTGDARAHGVRPEVTQVFDLDGPRLAGLAAAAGLLPSVAATPTAPPADLRPRRLLLKEHAGARLCFVNHTESPARLAGFVAAARQVGVTMPFIAGVAVYTDDVSAAALRGFPGLELDPARVAAVLDAPDPLAAGIDAAVEEARRALAVPGVIGVNLSGLASGDGLETAAKVKAAIGREIRGR